MGAGQPSPPATCRCVRLSVRVRDRRPEPPPCSVRAVRCVRAAGRVSPRLRPVRRRQRRDRRRSWPGSAPRSAQPCSPARRRPAGEVRHRPYCEGTSRRRHRTDTAPADRRVGRSLRPDDAVWCGSRHGCGRRLHRCNADFTPCPSNGDRAPEGACASGARHVRPGAQPGRSTISIAVSQRSCRPSSRRFDEVFGLGLEFVRGLEPLESSARDALRRQEADHRRTVVDRDRLRALPLGASRACARRAWLGRVGLCARSRATARGRLARRAIRPWRRGGP